MLDPLRTALFHALRALLPMLLAAPLVARGGALADSTSRGRTRPLPRLGWITVTDARGAFSVAMPPDTQSAVVRSPKSRGDSVELHLLTASLPDRSQFAAVYADPVADNVILDEDLSLATMRRRLLAAIPGVALRTSAIRVEGYPGSDVVIAVDDHHRAYCRVVQRGDRTYGLVAKVTTAQSDSVTAIAMLNSLHILPAQPASWRSFSFDSLSFHASFPGEPVISDKSASLREESLAPWRSATEVYARDPGSGLLYTVLAAKFSATYRDDDTLVLFDHFERRLLMVIDSVVGRRDLYVDGFPAREVTTRHGTNHALRRLRMVLHGEDFFTLSLVAPPEEIGSARAGVFFESFHPVGTVRSTELFSSRLAEVIAAIDGRDPAASARARAELDAMHLGARDRPDIDRLLEHPRPDDSLGPRGVRGMLIRSLSSSPDATTVQFLARLARGLSGAEELRAATITYIAWIGTAAALDTAATLIDHYREDFVRREIDPFRTVRDRLDTLVRVFPHYFELLDVPGLQGALLPLAAALVRWKGIDSTTLSRVVPSFVHGAVLAVRHGDSAFVAKIVDVAAQLPKSSSVDGLLRAIAASRDHEIARMAIVALVRRRSSVPDSLVDLVAADPRETMPLYRELAELHRPDLLPTRYRDQRLIAASTIIVRLDREGTSRVDSVALEEARELAFHGNPRRFFLFKYRRANDSVWHPAVTGPFSLDAANLDPTSAGVWISGETFDPVVIQRYFGDALQSMETRRETAPGYR